MRAIAGVLRERAEEMIDRQREPVPRIPIAQQEPPLLDDHLLHRRQEVEDVGLDERLVLGLPDRHRRAAPQQLVHQALEVGRQVLEDDEGHPGVGRQPGEEPLERLEPAGRGPDRDDVKPGVGRGRVVSHAPPTQHKPIQPGSSVMGGKWVTPPSYFDTRGYTPALHRAAQRPTAEVGTDTAGLQETMDSEPFDRAIAGRLRAESQALSLSVAPAAQGRRPRRAP